MQLEFLIEQAFGCHHSKVNMLEHEGSVYLPEVGITFEVAVPAICRLWWNGRPMEFTYALAYALAYYDHLTAINQSWLRDLFGLHLGAAIKEGHRWWRALMLQAANTEEMVRAQE